MGRADARRVGAGGSPPGGPPRTCNGHDTCKESEGGPRLQPPHRPGAPGVRRRSPWRPFPLALVQEGGGEAWGRTTGANALFCFTAEMTLAGENEKMPCALLQFEGRVTEEAAMVGLDGTTATKHTGQDAAPQGGRQRARTASPGTGPTWWGAGGRWDRGVGGPWGVNLRSSRGRPASRATLPFVQ